jgi:hypothetical protein
LLLGAEGILGLQDLAQALVELRERPTQSDALLS